MSSGPQPTQTKPGSALQLSLGTGHKSGGAAVTGAGTKPVLSGFSSLAIRPAVPASVAGESAQTATSAIQTTTSSASVAGATTSESASTTQYAPLRLPIEIQSGDVIKLIEQFLKENGLVRTFHTLVEESGVSMNTVSDIEKFLLDVLNGNWSQVLEDVRDLTLPQAKLADLYEHIFFELVQARETDTARALLRSVPELQLLQDTDYDRYFRLEQLLQRPGAPTDAELYAQGKMARRQELAVSLKSDIVVSAPSRLLTLLNYALRWQLHTGAIPHPDLFKLAPLRADSSETSKQQGSAEATENPIYDIFLGKFVHGAGADEAAARLDETSEHAVSKPFKTIRLADDANAMCVAMSPDGVHIAIGTSDGFIESYAVETGELSKLLSYQAKDEPQLLLHDTSVTSLVFSRDGTWLASGGSNGDIKLWHYETGRCIHKLLKICDSSVASLAFSPDGSLLAAGDGTTIRVFGMRSGALLKEFLGHSHTVTSLHFSEDANFLISASEDGDIRVWDFAMGACVRHETVTDAGIAAADSKDDTEESPRSYKVLSVRSMVRISGRPDMWIVAAGTPDMRVFNLISGGVQRVYTVKAAGGAPPQFVFASTSAKAKFVYGASADGIVCCFDRDSGKPSGFFKAHAKELLGIVHHPIKNILATFSADHTVRLWK